MENSIIRVDYAVRKEIMKILDVTYPTIRKALNGETDTELSKKIRQTPYQWMLDRKMEEINSLVVNSDIKITDIAEMYDFKSISHLVTLYTKRYGISPQKSRLSKLSDL